MNSTVTQALDDLLQQAVACHHAGQLQEAERFYRAILQTRPDHPGVHDNLKALAMQAELIALFTKGRFAEAETLAHTMTERFPQNGFGWVMLGMLFRRKGQSADALAFMEKGVELSPDYAAAHNNLGIILFDFGRLEEAEASYRRALQIKPNFAEAHNNLGSVLCDLGRLMEAEASCRRALEIKADSAEAHNNLGGILHKLGRLDEAEASCRKALQINPDFAEAYSNLGVALKDLGQLDAAVASYHRAMEIRPELAEAHNNLGNALNSLGRLDEAVASYRRALQIKPDYVDAHSGLIFSLDLSEAADLPELFEERKKWDAAHAAALWREPAHANDRTPNRRLRVGYVSADFREHSAAIVFGAMLTRYDRAQFEVFAYSNFKGKGDRLTDLFRHSVTVWRNIAGQSDEAAAQLIREDRIDILVDLSGFTTGNRLLVFARKPAPVQINAWGYATGTGMRAMDVFFADPVMVPPQDQQYFREEVRYLPCAVGSFFNEPSPNVNELPALSGGGITFGSFNRLVKVTDKTLRAWAEILRSVPGSRLILKAGELDNASVRERIVGHFTQAGVAADRIVMLGKTLWIEHMQAYHQVDFALDPFPHGGGVTALEGLMMGVPAVTLRWPSTTGRVSASIMTTLGLSDWVAETQDQYVELAVQKAKDLQSLAALRRQLRGIFTSSVIGEPAAYARVVEREYRQLWREWCANGSLQEQQHF